MRAAGTGQRLGLLGVKKCWWNSVFNVLKGISKAWKCILACLGNNISSLTNFGVRRGEIFQTYWKPTLVISISLKSGLACFPEIFFPSLKRKRYRNSSGIWPAQLTAVFICIWAVFISDQIKCYKQIIHQILEAHSRVPLCCWWDGALAGSHAPQLQVCTAGGTWGLPGVTLVIWL